MPSILRIDASPRGADSYSRAIADSIENSLLAAHPEATINRRDLALQDLPSLSQSTITGFFSPKDSLSAELQAATALSDELIAELKAADTLIISAPMYNFGVPGSVKAWIDQIVRVNETFSFDGSSFQGLVDVKQAYLALSYGAEGYTGDGALAGMNFFEPYLVSLLGFLGIAQTQVFRIEGTSTLAPEALSQAKDTLGSEISAFVEGQ